MNEKDISFLQTLEDIVVARRESPQAESYTSSLFAAGTQRIAQKVGEEAIEVALAACNEDSEELKGEVADLLYHLLVLIADQRLALSDVISTLHARHAS